MAVQNNPQYVKAGSSFSGCPGTALVSGYYEYGSSTPVITGYANPATGKGWTPAELSAFMQGGGTTGGTTTGTAGTAYNAGGAITPTGSGTSAYPAQNISGLYAGCPTGGAVVGVGFAPNPAAANCSGVGFSIPAKEV